MCRSSLDLTNWVLDDASLDCNGFLERRFSVVRLEPMMLALLGFGLSKLLDSGLSNPLNVFFVLSGLIGAGFDLPPELLLVLVSLGALVTRLFLRGL
jgi:hypothetical protein